MFVSLPDHECLMKMKSASRLDSENIFFISYVTYVSMNNKSRKEIRSEEIIVGTRFSLFFRQLDGNVSIDRSYGIEFSLIDCSINRTF